MANSDPIDSSDYRLVAGNIWSEFKNIIKSYYHYCCFVSWIILDILIDYIDD
jgi:hypothetical protein